MNERASCAGCLHRRPISHFTPDYMVCHYLIDSGEARGSAAQKCVHWQPTQKSLAMWVSLPECVGACLKEGNEVG